MNPFDYICYVPMFTCVAYLTWKVLNFGEKLAHLLMTMEEK